MIKVELSESGDNSGSEESKKDGQVTNNRATSIDESTIGTDEVRWTFNEREDKKVPYTNLSDINVPGVK